MKCMKAVRQFRGDPQVLHTFKLEVTNLLQGHVIRASYNVFRTPSCLPRIMVSSQLSMTLFKFLFPLHSNAQCPSSVTGMMREELLEGLKRRRLGDTDHAVIVVREHKTGLSSNHYHCSTI